MLSTLEETGCGSPKTGEEKKVMKKKVVFHNSVFWTNGVLGATLKFKIL